ncbi:hypothetical protein BJ138DRAFT_1114405 [Hygrophoropsis aurantiaca]|uniref:Uncharacterized protein n=1 Tax=Hygrophoropsis aurantiaca TaxID=72124 RepID=A0ACB8AAH9_9AGAM|nr:hypothetical protein BJ138DRAFT_1114405 [Hygrophoropsis aurantiaca]
MRARNTVVYAVRTPDKHDLKFKALKLSWQLASRNVEKDISNSIKLEGKDVGVIASEIKVNHDDNSLSSRESDRMLRKIGGFAEEQVNQLGLEEQLLNVNLLAIEAACQVFLEYPRLCHGALLDKT